MSTSTLTTTKTKKYNVDENGRLSRQNKGLIEMGNIREQILRLGQNVCVTQLNEWSACLWNLFNKVSSFKCLLFRGWCQLIQIRNALSVSATPCWSRMVDSRKIWITAYIHHFGRPRKSTQVINSDPRNLKALHGNQTEVRVRTLPLDYGRI